MIRAVLVWLLLAGGAMAQDIAVQAGEHPGFTRLALRIGAGAGWRFGRTEEGYGLRLETARDFAAGRVFDTIPRDRIAAVAHGPGTIDLAVACPCHAAVFVHAEEWLVIDIADGPPRPGDPLEAWVDRPAVAPAAPALPLFTQAPPFFLLPGALAADAPAPPPDPRAAQLGRDMAGAIAAAAGRGLLDLAVAPSAESRPAPAPSAAPIPDGPLVPPSPAGLPGIAAHDAAERPVPAATGLSCPDSAAFDLAAWAGSGDFAHETARAWAALTDGRDLILPDAAEDLARRYIAFGFGREALQVLALDPQASVARDRLVALAHIVDDRPVGPAVFARAEACPGPIALWQALAAGSVAAQPEAARTAAVTALRLLPMPLRAQLAPRLAAAFAAGGDPLAAEDMLRDYGNTAGQARVDTALAAQDHDTALGLLQDMAGADPHLAPDDLVRLVDLTLGAGQEVDAQTRGLLAAAQFERRGSPAETDLLLAEIRSLSAAGDHAAALARILDLPAPQRPPAREPVLIALAQSPGGTAFVETVFAADLADLTPAAGNALAGRLIAEGFPDIALTLLAPAATGADQAERRYLRAEAAAALGRPDLVEAELLGLDDPRARAIRAGVDPAVAPALADWRMADWAALAGAEDALLSAAANAQLTGAADLAQAPPLAGRAALLSDAAAARQLARDLLARFGPP